MFNCRTGFRYSPNNIVVMMKHVYATKIKLWYMLHWEHYMHKRDMLVVIVRNDNRAPLMKSTHVVKVIPICHSVYVQKERV